MIEMTERATITESFFHVTMSECGRCYSLQPCISNDTSCRCVDWRACPVRESENKSDRPLLTPADQAALLDRMEIMVADMQRLKRIESAAITFVQASEAFTVGRGHSARILGLHGDLIEAVKVLIAVVKS